MTLVYSWIIHNIQRSLFLRDNKTHQQHGTCSVFSEAFLNRSPKNK